jgi:hypothetical protein
LRAYDKATPIIAPASAEAVAEVILGILLLGSDHTKSGILATVASI